MVKKFDSSIVDLTIKDSITSLLPPYFRTTKNEMFLDTTINELFRKGSGIQVNGYIGSKPDWYDASTDFYVSEMNNDRTYYQLTPAMTSIDDTGEISNIVHFSDYVNNLQVNGANIDNQNRLFEQEYVSWCPPINLDMFVNYVQYYWKGTSPDFMIMEKNASDMNPWSVNNNWYHISDITDDISNYTKAERPIICFVKNIELYNYGTYRRNNVSFYNNTITDISTLNGVSSFVIDGITINQEYLENNNVTILLVNEKTSQYNNMVYQIIWLNGSINYQIVTDGENSTGTPANGEIIKITNGTYINQEYYFNGLEWVTAQEKNNINQAPLFNLYSYNYDSSTNTESYVILNDTTYYPSNNFYGNKIISYSLDEDEYYPYDSLLNMYVNRDSDGNLLFENYIVTDQYSYVDNLITQTIDGLYFYKVNGYYSNNWYNKSTLSTQWMVDEFVSDGTTNVFSISQDPINENSIEVVVGSKSTDNVSNITSKTLTYNVDYIEIDKNVVIYDISDGDTVQIRTYNPNTPTDYNGYYELPISLTANSTYEIISTFNYGDVFSQFIQIMSNQENFSGSSYGINNYRNLTNIDFSKGDSIIETSSSMLLNMALVSNENINVPSSIRYCSDQYRIYKFKFINKISEQYQTGVKNDISNIDQWVEDALISITKGNTSTFPFYNSKVGITSTYSIDHFIPPTPSFLGLEKATSPYITIDYTSPLNPTVIVGHDGSITLAFGDIRDDVILAYEQRIYDSIAYNFKQQNYKPFNIFDYVDNGFNTNREYSLVEWNDILEQNFLYWIANHNIDYRTNTTYDSTNPFTWNWGNVLSNIDNSYLPGGWRGIYQYYFGTDAPHSKPWEMLGFTYKPSYWDGKYGPAPYTSENVIMWSDIENGIIYGTSNPLYIRKGLSNYLPVDNQGYLLDPVQCNIAKNYPNSYDAQNPWSFGDISPIENVWRRSSEYKFALQSAAYLAKPSMYVSYNWNTQDFRIINIGEPSEQWINSETLDRPQFSEYTVHGEIIDNTSIYHYGFQQYISNYIISLSLNITTELGNILRGINTKLCYRFSGFVDSNNLNINSDSYGAIPSENINVELYESPINANIFYSGMLVIKQTNGWKIYGYDAINPYFNIYTVDDNSIGSEIKVDNYTKTIIPNWETSTYYEKNTVVTYHGKRYISLIDHVSTSYFEITKWQQISQDVVSNQNTVTWYNTLTDYTVNKIPYGYTVTSYQEMCDIMNGLQNYYESNGIRFDQTTNSTWKDIVKSFMTWDLSDSDVGEYIAFSPISGNVTINNDFGNIKDIFDPLDNFYNIIDASGKNIKSQNIRIVRSQSYTSVVPTDSVNAGIFGCRFYKNSIEHVALIDNETLFGNILRSPKFNVQQARLLIETYKTDQWEGRMLAPGFIVSGNTIIPNFDTTADNFRHFYDIEETFYNQLQERTRLNIGYFEKQYFDNMLITSTNQFEYYIGMIQHKGTNTVINRITRSNYVSNDRVFNFDEEWAFRIGTFGSVDNSKNIDFKIYQSDFSNNPQLYEITENSITTNITYTQEIKNSTNISLSDTTYSNIDSNYVGNVLLKDIYIISNNTNNSGNINLKTSTTSYITNYDISNGSTKLDVNETLYISGSTDLILETENNIDINIIINYEVTTINNVPSTSNHIVINDIKNENGKIIDNDSRWVYSDNQTIKFPSKLYNLDDSEFLSSAGYVSLDTIKWTALNEKELYTLYTSEKTNKPVQTINNSYTFNLTGNAAIDTIPLVLGKNYGFINIKSVTYNITKSFSYNVVINIGTQSQLPSDPSSNNYSSTLLDRYSVPTLTTGSTTNYLSDIYETTNISDSTIYIQIDHSNTGNIPSTINLGTIEVTINGEWIYQSIMPEDRVWVYDYNGDWNTFKFYNTGYKIDNISSNTSNNPVVSLPLDYTTTNNIDLSTRIPYGSLVVLNSSSQLTSTYYPRYSNTVSTYIDSSKTTTSICTLNNTAGMIINSMTINVLEPFSTSDGSELDITIGTTENTSLVADSSVVYNPYPSTPSFDQTSPVSVQLPNTTINYLTNSSTANVYITRSGNIYNLPNTCSDIPDTSFTWTLYTCDENGTIDTSNVLSTGNVTFGNPDNTSASKESYWLQTVNVSLTSGQYYAFEISNVSGGSLGSNTTSYINLSGTSESYVLFDPTRVGQQNISTSLLNLSLIDGDLNFTIGNNTTGQAYITIDYTYNNGFELYNIDGSDITLTDEVYGGNIFLWVPCRYSTMNDFNSSSFKYAFNNGNYVEIDDNNNLWNICQYENGNLVTYIQQEPQIISDLIDKAVIYNNVNGIVEEVLELYDPIKGHIPSVCRNNIDYILGYDPAKYSTSNTETFVNPNAWAETKVGSIWWNNSTAKYVDYEIGDYNYKWKNWGSLCPGYSIDIYEWVKSPVIPSSWNSYVSGGNYTDGFCQNPSGTVEDVTNTNWTEVLYYDEYKNIEITEYYFWVKNPTTQMVSGNRYTASQLANILENPTNNNISYFSIIDTNKILIGGIKQYINDIDTVIKIKWKNNISDVNFHKEWLLVKENDDTEKLDQGLWNKFENSIIGYKTISNTITNNFTLSNQFNVTDTSVTLTGDQENIIDIPMSGEIKIGKYWFVYNDKKDNVLYNIDNYTNIMFDAGTSVQIEYTSTSYIEIPDETLTDYEKIGILDYPRQSWFLPDLYNGNQIASRYARKMLVESINDIFATGNYLDTITDLSTIFTSYDTEPTDTAYTYHVTDFDYRNAYINNNIKLFDTILVDGNSETNNFWTLWQYKPYDFNADSYGFVLIDSQKWRLQEGELWSTVDWYADGYDSNDYPQYIFSSKDELEENIDNIDETLLNGTLVKIETQDTNDDRWSILRYLDGQWIEIAKQNSTIELNEQFYSSSIDYYITNMNLSNIPKRDGTLELQIILDSFYNTLFDNLQINQLFFNMVKVALTLSEYNDWVFKTSFMYLGGCYEQLKQKPTVETDIIDNVIDYINVVKPYHVKIRDYRSTYTIGPDLCNVHVSDFDFPSNNEKILYPYVENNLNYNNTNSNQDDTDTVNSSTYWSDWYNNYTKTNYDSSNYDANWNPVRHMIISTKFDRIACKSNQGWDSTPWDCGIEIFNSSSEEDNNGIISTLRTEYKNYNDQVISSYNNINTVTGYISGTIVYISGSDIAYIWDGSNWKEIKSIGWDSDVDYNGEIDRISLYYNPVGDMIKKEDTQDLIKGCGFTGTQVYGGPMESTIDFMYPWYYNGDVDNTLGYYTGNSETNKNITATNIDYDLSSNGLVNDPILPDGIIVYGTDISDPYTNNKPEELVEVHPMDSMVMTVTDNDGSGAVTDCRMFVDNRGLMDMIYYNDVGCTVVSDDYSTITVSGVNGDFPFHDPNNPSQEYLDQVKLSLVKTDMTEDQINEMLGRLNPGVIWINNEKIVYWTVTKSGDNYIISNLIRGYGVTSQKNNNSGFTLLSSPILSNVGDKVIDGSIMSWLIYDRPIKFTVKSDGMYFGNIKFI